MDEKITDSDTDTVKTDETDETEAAQDITASVSDSTDEAENEDTEQDVQNTQTQQSGQKEKITLQKPIIVAFCCLVVVLLGFLVYKCFFNTSIVGAWEIENTSTSDEASADEAVSNYLSFDNDGTATFHIGTLKQVGTYTISDDEDSDDDSEEDTKSITINITNVLQGTLAYSVEGNAFTGRTLTLTNTYYDQSLELTSASIKIPELEVSDDFEPNDKLTGSWEESDENDYIYYLTYEFRDDGTATINTADIQYIDCVYTYDDSTITLTYYAGEEISTELYYSFDGDTLSIDGLEYTKVDSDD